jgi:hypothetical protein
MKENLKNQALRNLAKSINTLAHTCACLPIDSPERKELIGICQRLEVLADHIKEDL